MTGAAPLAGDPRPDVVGQPAAPALTRLAARHLPDAVGLSSEMGWPYRLEDWAFAHRLGEGLALEQENKLIGTALRWHYGADFATVGMVIVARAHQGRGLGALLVDELLKTAGSRSILLNGTREAVELYGRRGFAPVGQVNQHQGVAVPATSPLQMTYVRAAGAADLPAIMDLDEGAAGMPRRELLNALVEAGRLIVTVERGVVTGYAVSRRFGRGHVIGPVVADGIVGAQMLIEHAMAELPGEFVRVDCPSGSSLSPWLEAVGLVRVDTVTAMVRGQQPQPSGPPRIFALCSQSLG